MSAAANTAEIAKFVECVRSVFQDVEGAPTVDTLTKLCYIQAVVQGTRSRVEKMLSAAATNVVDLGHVESTVDNLPSVVRDFEDKVKKQAAEKGFVMDDDHDQEPKQEPEHEKKDAAFIRPSDLVAAKWDRDEAIADAKRRLERDIKQYPEHDYWSASIASNHCGGYVGRCSMREAVQVAEQVAEEIKKAGWHVMVDLDSGVNWVVKVRVVNPITSVWQ